MASFQPPVVRSYLEQVARGRDADQELKISAGNINKKIKT